MATLSEILGEQANQQSHIKRQFVYQRGAVIDRFELYKDIFKLEDSGTKIFEQSIGSGFILTHIRQGLLGTGLDPQPVLGDDRGDFIEIGPSGLIP